MQYYRHVFEHASVTPIFSSTHNSVISHIISAHFSKQDLLIHGDCFDCTAKLPINKKPDCLTTGIWDVADRTYDRVFQVQELGRHSETE